MRHIIIFFALLPIWLSAQVGGAGTCHVSGNPNSIPALEVQSLIGDCLTAIDTLTGDLYRYNPTLSEGSRWEVLGGTVSTLSNGLNLSGSTGKLGGSLTENTTIAAGAFGLTVTTTGAGVPGISTQSPYTGVQAVSTSGNPSYLGSTSNSTTNTVLSNLSLLRSTTGTAANGIGQSIQFATENTSNVNVVTNEVKSLWSDATHATRTSRLIITGVNSGTSADLLTIEGNGQIKANTYGSGTHTGTAAKWIAVTSAGAFIEEDAPSGGGVSITSTTLETTSITAVVGKITLVDCSAAARTVNPPSSPTLNQRFAVSDAKGASATYNITVDFTTATQKLYGATQNYIINANGGYIEFIYVDSTTGWIATKG